MPRLSDVGGLPLLLALLASATPLAVCFSFSLASDELGFHPKGSSESSKQRSLDLAIGRATSELFVCRASA
jgi:hypothetical protein